MSLWVPGSDRFIGPRIRAWMSFSVVVHPPVSACLETSWPAACQPQHSARPTGSSRNICQVDEGGIVKQINGNAYPLSFRFLFSLRGWLFGCSILRSSRTRRTSSLVEQSVLPTGLEFKKEHSLSSEAGGGGTLGCKKKIKRTVCRQPEVAAFIVV